MNIFYHLLLSMYFNFQTSNMSVYDDLILHISPDKFYVESLTATKVILVIDRINYNISLETNNDQIPAIASRSDSVVNYTILLIGECSTESRLLVLLASSLSSLDPTCWSSRGKLDWGLSLLVRERCGRFWRLRSSVTPGMWNGGILTSFVSL